VALALAFVPFSGADSWRYNRLFRLRGAVKPGADVVLVTFQEETVPAFPNKREATRPSRHPWEDARHGWLLAAVVAQAPRRVAFVSPFDGYVRGHAGPGSWRPHGTWCLRAWESPASVAPVALAVTLMLTVSVATTWLVLGALTALLLVGSFALLAQLQRWRPVSSSLLWILTTCLIFPGTRLRAPECKH
jgi:CHASE2 domain-containing sensor protein